MKKSKKYKSFIEKETLMPFWLLGSAIIAAILHNLIFAFSGAEEVAFFILTLILILGFFISVILNTLLYVNQGRPKDIWKLGWLGLFGILGIFAPGLFGFFGFFGYFGLKR